MGGANVLNGPSSLVVGGAALFVIELALYRLPRTCLLAAEIRISPELRALPAQPFHRSTTAGVFLELVCAIRSVIRLEKGA